MKSLGNNRKIEEFFVFTTENFAIIPTERLFRQLDLGDQTWKQVFPLVYKKTWDLYDSN